MEFGDMQLVTVASNLPKLRATTFSNDRNQGCCTGSAVICHASGEAISVRRLVIDFGIYAAAFFS